MDRFATTRWSLIRTAASGSGQRDALEALCRVYRPPVLAYVRAHYGPAEAEDLTQAFFTHLLESSLPQRADSGRGRFRAFLLTALKNFVASRLAHERALRRGGGAQRIAIDEAVFVDDDGPEQAFENAWAQTVLREALRAVAKEAHEAGRGPLFEQLRPFLFESPGADDYRRIAEATGLRRNTVAVAVHRLRARVQDLVHALVADTTTGEEDAEAELRQLRLNMARAPAGSAS